MSETGFSKNKSGSSECDHALLNINAFGVLLVSPEGLIVEFNKCFESMLNISSEDFKEKPVNYLPFQEESLKEHPLPYDNLKFGEEETEIHKLDFGDGHSLMVSMNTFKMADGYSYSLFHDITEKRRIEENLRMKSMFLEAVANSSADGILVVDLTGKIILQNQRALDLWEITPEIADDSDGNRQVAHVMKMTKNPEQFVAEIEHQKTHPFETTVDELELVNGTFLHRHSAPVLGEDGKNYGRIYHFHDITSFRKAEEQIRALLKEKELILREVHHRVKNYMSTLIGLLVLQASSLTEESAIEALNDAKSRLSSMMSLYNKLYVSGEGSSISIKEYLPALIDEIIKNFPKHDLVSIEKDIDDLVLDAKKLQVISIITNELLTNIMKYAFEGRSSGNVKVKFKVQQEEVTFTIKDDGVGIKSNDKKSAGGFGLMLVNTLVNQLQGTIDFKRNEGTEATIVFRV